MTKHYFLIAAGLLLGVGACSSDSTKQGASSAAHPPGLPATVADTIAVSIPPAPASQPKVSVAAAAPRAAKDFKATWRHNPDTAPRLKPKRGATTMADVEEDPAYGMGSTAVGEAASRAELVRLLRAALPPAQTFTVRPGRDTMLVGAQGTQLLLPANAWDLPVGAGPVRLQLEEFYQLPDMLLAGLGTMSGDSLLETGGMLQLTATDATGRPAPLRPDAAVLLRMPTSKRNPRMRLYQGVPHSGPHGQYLDWQLPAPGRAGAKPRPLVRYGTRGPASRNRKRPLEAGSPASSDSLLAPLPSSRYPEYLAGEKQWPADVLSALQQVRGRAATPNPGRSGFLSRLFARRREALRPLTVSFTVDTTGRIGRCIVPRGTDAGLARHVRNALRSVGRWQPATQAAVVADSVGAVRVPASGKIYLEFNAAGAPVRVSDYGFRWRPLKEDKSRRSKLDSLRHTPAFRARYQVRRAARIAAERAQWRAMMAQRAAEFERMRAQFSDTATYSFTKEGVYHDFLSQGFGYLNCDAAILQEFASLQVVTPPRNEVMTLVINQFRSVLQPYATDTQGHQTFRTPLNFGSTLVALRRENGITYLALHDVKPDMVKKGELNLVQLDYHPVTIAELRAELAKRLPQ